MTRRVPDAFALLDLPRRPWLTPESVRAAFQRRAAAAHPDVGGNASDFSALTWAHETLRSPAARLRYLLENDPSTQSVPGELMDLFPQVARVLRGADRVEEIGEVQALVAKELNRAEEDLRSFDLAWPERAGLAALQARFAILEKWITQLREARLRLEIG